jgi:hypothetical protein
MNPDEIRQLLSFVHAVCPQQRIQPDTWQAWRVLLGRVSYTDAYEAAKRVASRERFINPSDILGEVRAARYHRIPRLGEEGSCVLHPGNWTAGCGPCRSELIGKMD